MRATILFLLAIVSSGSVAVDSDHPGTVEHPFLIGQPIPRAESSVEVLSVDGPVASNETERPREGARDGSREGSRRLRSCGGGRASRCPQLRSRPGSSPQRPATSPAAAGDRSRPWERGGPPIDGAWWSSSLNLESPTPSFGLHAKSAPPAPWLIPWPHC